jgi:hypothetical protein
MRVSSMFNTNTTDHYIAQSTTSLFRWGWDFNQWVPWMLHYPLRPPRKNHPLLKLNSKKITHSLSGSSTSSNRFRIFNRSSMPRTSSAMINIECHTSFRWEINCGCSYRRNSLRGPIRRFIHSSINLTPSPRL